jgi:hypothetical protein
MLPLKALDSNSDPPPQGMLSRRLDFRWLSGFENGLPKRIF